MKKFENFCRCLDVLKGVDIKAAHQNEVYRMGVIGQFNLCFELAWKALQPTLVWHGVEAARTGSPREIVKLGFKVGFVDDELVWLDMLQKRNLTIHTYSEPTAEEVLELIMQNYIPAFERFKTVLAEKIKALDEATQTIDKESR